MERLFVAINFSDAVRRELQRVRNAVATHSVRGSFTRPENFHLTLVFLGACDAEQTRKAKQITNAQSFNPFSLTINGIGSRRKGQEHLAYCTLQEDEGLWEAQLLQQSLYKGFSANGFELEQRTFWPHVTLGRRIVWNKKEDPVDVAKIHTTSVVEHVSRITLMRSEHIDGKLTYTPVK